MSLRVPPLTTNRLVVRDYTLGDLDVLNGVLHRAWQKEPGTEAAELPATRAYLEWSVRNYPALADLTQPPYGERAVILRATGELIGAIGYVPSFGPFDQLVADDTDARPPRRLSLPAFGLFWAIDPLHQGKGYATEAGDALISYAFEHLDLARIVAMTEYENIASQGVMRKLGMRLMHNPYPDPPWFQVVGVLDNPRATAQRAL